jgi:hypothetical protein
VSKIRWVPDPHDPDRGLKIGIDVDPVTNEIVIVQVEDVEPLLAINRRAYRESSAMVRAGETWGMWARIPPGIHHHWKAKFGVDLLKDEDWPKVVQLLHDKDWEYLRTASGDYRERTPRTYYRGSSAPNANAISRIGQSGAPGRVRRTGIVTAL